VKVELKFSWYLKSIIPVTGRYYNIRSKTGRGCTHPGTAALARRIKIKQISATDHKPVNHPRCFTTQWRIIRIIFLNKQQDAYKLTTGQ